MAVRQVAFELECFEWADERLEVAGRWKGLGGRRLNRPVLTVETEGGRRKHLIALPGGHLGAAEESWRAAFAWPGDPAEITGAELEVGGNVVVDLPLPDRRRRRRKKQPSDTGDEALVAEIAALRGQVERLRGELAGRERENMQLRTELEPADDDPVADAGATVEIERMAGERDELTAEVARLSEERDRTRDELSAEIERLHAERDRMRVEHDRLRDEADRARADVDLLREAFAEAAAEAEAVRDRHNAEIAALQEELHAEREAVSRLTTALASGPELPPPATPSARRAAAAPPTVAMPAPFEDRPAVTDDAADRPEVADDAADAKHADATIEDPPEVTDDAAGPDDTTEPFDRAAAPDAARLAAAAPPTEQLSAIVDVASVPGVLDPPGPLRAGARPATQPGIEDEAAPSRVPAWLRAGRRRGEPDDGVQEEAGPPSGPLFAALKSRLEHLFTSNGHTVAEEDEELDREEPIPGPVRSAAAARARAGATVAARRSPVELWAARVVAALVVAILLIAFVLILTSIA